MSEFEGKDAETARIVHEVLTAPIVDPIVSYMRGVVSLATPGEWYVWQDSENKSVQLMSRTHGAILPKLPSSPQRLADLTAIVFAVNMVRPTTGGASERAADPRPEVGRCSCGAVFYSTEAATEHECPYDDPRPAGPPA